MRKLLSICAAATVMLGATSAMAEGYGPAGCGLGSIIFKPNSGFTQIFAATTNGTLGNQTFGITSGTSNCKGSSGGAAGTKEFVETNRAALEKDMSRGKGETIASLSKMAGCKSSESVGRTLQANYSKVVPSAAAKDTVVSKRVVKLLKSSKKLQCKKL